MLFSLILYLQIKRPYFHVKPLERCQLKNWQEYLDFEIEQGDQERIITLFERCLIACALYEEFWLRVCNQTTVCVLFSNSYFLVCSLLGRIKKSRAPIKN